MPLVHDGAFGLTASAHEGHNAVIDSPASDAQPDALDSAGQLKAGQSTEFVMGMKWRANVPHDDIITSVRSESPNIDVELVQVREEGDTTDVQVKVTAKGDHRGALYAPIRFYASKYDCPAVVLGQIVD